MDAEHFWGFENSGIAFLLGGIGVIVAAPSYAHLGLALIGVGILLMLIPLGVFLYKKIRSDGKLGGHLLKDDQRYIDAVIETPSGPGLAEVMKKDMLKDLDNFQRAKKAAESSPLELLDDGKYRYFSWRGRTDGIDSIPTVDEPSQLYQFAKVLCDKIRTGSKMEPIFSPGSYR